ncbi:MAG: heme-binding protein [Neomegalonema sp.]|nr:heme-binding protein [Neomegalonema sp.]
MTALSLQTARTIIAAALAKGNELGLKPLSVVVLDAGAGVTAFEREDGASRMRFEIAFGKANGAIALGTGSRAIFERAQQQPFFIGAINGLADGKLVPVPGGVLIKTAQGALLGAVGVTGDTSDNDEIAAVAGIEAAGYVAQVN